ncbi:hypothetical protein MTBBW1_2690002 [Desulfamplus magnetovallimortis]|uniref:Uncharacterized protein n=1 Tax=Desulfamplus magnetovallimortis TaxID=1246637 RepID=A0A1W1HF23_9BACT|nr:hypothetical protein [Desulfamplus magnetovallimortis]SLM31089.1 hypothetical protein MTBBW1_2690002 [Desulfamplus magnetovallimortis]
MQMLSLSGTSEKYVSDYDIPCVGKGSFSTLSVDTILAEALKERDEILSRSSLLKEFQKEIDTALNGFTEVNLRFEGLADAARSFNNKREISERLAEFRIEINNQSINGSAN